ncbi:putative ABC transporter permease [Paenibacillus glufosinatiresistens]|uniref:putative ABC transporter permease n=1 Tax=Paenibacillus glufosinatiresistens TaxID=3070657 RepID=UPI00286DF5CD|nr:putative ABC transporter permease [Paenibacillus sp. YX.27]
MAGGSDWREYAFYFLGYAVLGWMLESFYNRYSAGTFLKENFLKGPYKPMYGFAPAVLVAAGGTSLSWYLFALLTLMVPSAVEYASGVWLNRCFGRGWWHYGNHRFQWGGHICLRFSMYWWALSAAVLLWLQPFMSSLYAGGAPLWNTLVPMVLVLLAADFAWTWRMRRRPAAEFGGDLQKG